MHRRKRMDAMLLTGTAWMPAAHLQTGKLNCTRKIALKQIEIVQLESYFVHVASDDKIMDVLTRNKLQHQ